MAAHGDQVGAGVEGQRGAFSAAPTSGGDFLGGGLAGVAPQCVNLEVGQSAGALDGGGDFVGLTQGLLGAESDEFFAPDHGLEVFGGHGSSFSSRR